MVTRPLPDRVRESLFNLLRGHFDDVPVLDLFAGTGSFGLEAASRGASRVVLVEQNRQVAKVLQENVDQIGARDVCEVVLGDALGAAALNRCPKPVHVVLLDPPYPLIKDREGWERVRRQTERLIDLLDDTGYLMLRTPWPFWHMVEPEGAAEPEPARKGPHKSKSAGAAGVAAPKRHVVVDADTPDEDLEALDAFEAELAQAAGAEQPVKVPADLTFPNAEGPETHVYKNTAVHLYMRAGRPGTDDAGEPATGS